MTDEQRARIACRLAELRAIAEADDSPENRKGRLALVASMLMAYPTSGGSEESGKARAQAYLGALDDIPPWAISEAIKSWHKGNWAGQHNYRFAPAPAELRGGALEVLQPAKQTIVHLEHVLAALTITEAMDPNPIEITGLNTRFALRAIQ